MSSVPAGKRSWKCPECGNELLLSVTQLDPMACDACLAKLKGAGKSGSVPSVSDAVAGPLGVWQALPETIKLSAVVVALVLGLVVGYLAGNASAPHGDNSIRERHRTIESSPSSKTVPTKPATSDGHDEDRPAPPGPGYKWVQGRKHKDGTRGAGHWAPETRRKSDDDSPSKSDE